jgi:hypothetical protein
MQQDTASPLRISTTPVVPVEMTSSGDGRISSYWTITDALGLLEVPSPSI